jgi:hypothetical protein
VGRPATARPRDGVGLVGPGRHAGNNRENSAFVG